MNLVQQVVIIMGFRSLIVLGFSVMLFVQWFKSDKKSIRDFKFLFGLQFFFLSCAKIFDIFFALEMGSVGVISEPSYLNILKLRWILMIANIVPLFSLLVFVWLYKSIKKQILFNAVFIITSLLLVTFAPSYVFLQALLVIMLLPVIILSIITFFNLHKHRRLPQFNSLLMAISQIFYLIMQILRPLLISTSIARDINLIVSEWVEVMIWVLMGLCFIIKPRFTRTQTQKIIV
ncbi:MAG: hypothetical protein JW776_02755 [Candidatus Lokiarchaeota archaeon]|nr:hypothetical protein [Candidatus Lokiarchaeota archaeon]